jgi:hypothetical protein
MSDLASTQLRVQRPRARRRIRFVRNLLLAAMLAIVLAAAAGGAALVVAAQFPAYEDVGRAGLYEAVKQVAIDIAGENPRLTPNPVAGSLPLCDPSDEVSNKPFALAFGLMRATPEGLRLFEVVTKNGVCVAVDEIAYNAAYAEARRSGRDDWSTSKIVIDRDLVRSGAADVLAAVLVHEATHIDRAISGEACFIHENCKRLPNGVDVDEEVAAHAAEAEWWIAAFGTDGKRFAMRADYSENRLLRAYLRGGDSFRAYVASFRDDPREGEDF